MARILHVVRPSSGGAFGHAKVLSREFSERGFEVAICGPAEQRRHDLPVRHFDVEIGREISPRNDLRSLRRVAGVLRDFRPDLIHAHGSQAGVIARVARAALPRAPLVHTPHQYAFVNYFGGPSRHSSYKLLERALMPLASRVLCVCEAERRLALSIGAGRRARVVYNGVLPLEPAPLPADLEDPTPSPGPLLVALAELQERKGLVTLIEAMPSIRESNPGARLVIAGEGPDRLELEGLRDGLGLQGIVRMPGHVSGVAGLLTAADVFVNPAWAEAFPYAVLEAMSLAKPCVVTDVGGTAEAIVEGESGLVVGPRDPEAIALAVSRLLADKELAVRFGEAAKHRLLHRFTREQMIEGTLALYAELGLESPH